MPIEYINKYKDTGVTKYISIQKCLLKYEVVK